MLEEATQPVLNDARDAWSSDRDKSLFILRQLVLRDFKLKYRRSFLGVAWSVLNPLFMMIVMAAVFSMFMRFSSDSIPSYPLYIILGNVTFSLMADSTSQGMGSILGAASLLKKVRIRRWLFPVEKVLFAVVNFAISLIAVLIVMIAVGVHPTWTALLLPLFLVYLGMFCVGLSMLLSSVSVFFRDVMHMWSVILTAWTYATPLFYPAEILPSWMMTLERFNPMFHYVAYIRELLLYQRLPSLQLNAACLACGVIMLVVGLIVFRKSEHKFILFI
ncbi:MAG: ABC transporter permease [Coriobacteriales bacterium]|nr:ABC transporter permease [Coriobacteriales bacterium]